MMIYNNYVGFFLSFHSYNFMLYTINLFYSFKTKLANELFVFFKLLQ